MSPTRRDSHQCRHIHRGQSHLTWNRNEAPRLTIDPGDVVTFDCIDGGNGQITAQSTSDAIANFDSSLADPVFGPVYIRGAEPGDALQVEVVDLRTADWGWTAVVPGFGLLADEFPDAHLKVWKLPMGEKLAWFNDRIHIPRRPFLGTMGIAPGEEGDFSTIPPRDTGGNIDCKSIVKGTKLILPVRIAGALFSCGDGHAAQGDGEVCGVAIETPISATLRFSLLKNQHWVRSPQFVCPRSSGEEEILPDCGSYNVMGVASDMLEATRNAVRSMIDYLEATRGLSRVEAYMLCSVAVDMSLTEVVDMPNYAVVASLPLNIFVEEHADRDT